MITSLLIIIIKGTNQVGGLQKIWSINLNGGRLNFFNFDFDPFIRQVNFSFLFSYKFH
jgi:hypothetical protein